MEPGRPRGAGRRPAPCAGSAGSTGRRPGPSSEHAGAEPSRPSNIEPSKPSSHPHDPPHRGGARGNVLLPGSSTEGVVARSRCLRRRICLSRGDFAAKPVSAKFDLFQLKIISSIHRRHPPNTSRDSPDSPDLVGGAITNLWRRQNFNTICQLDCERQQKKIYVQVRFQTWTPLLE